MFGNLKASMVKSLVQAKLKAGGLICPECGEKGVNIPAKWDGLMDCGKCGARASLTEWAAASGTMPLRGRAGDPPVGTKIRVSTDSAGGKVWEIPASRKPGFFLFFSLFWLAITALVSGGFLLTFLSGGEIEGDMPEWLLIPFFGIFWAVGLGTFYAGLQQMLAQHRIAVGGGCLTWRREMLGRVKEISLASTGITDLAQREFYQQNYKPIYGIEIKGPEGKIRFGTTLSEPEKAWLVADLRKAALPEPEEFPSVGAGVVGGVLAPMKVGGIVSTEPFSVVIPGMGKQGFWGALAFIAVGGGFVAIGVLVMADEDWIGFRGFWTGFSSIFALAGLWMLAKCVMERGKERRIEGNATEISLRTYHRGLILKDKSFPRREITDIRASSSGSSGTTPMKRVELILGDRAEKIAAWIDGNEADRLVAKVRGALGK